MFDRAEMLRSTMPPDVVGPPSRKFLDRVFGKGKRMGVAELRSAFNEVAELAGFTCARAELSYENADGIQFQRLVFRGLDAAGQPFVVRSDLLPPDTDVTLAAKDVATKLIAEKPAP